MPDIFNPNTFDFFARYFLAGFILSTVRARYVIGEKPGASEVVYEAIILSLLNQLIFQALASLASWLEPHAVGLPPVAWAYDTANHFAFQIETLLLPALLGVLSGYALRSKWNLPILRHLAMPIVHPTLRPTITLSVTSRRIAS